MGDGQIIDELIHISLRFLLTCKPTKTVFYEKVPEKNKVSLSYLAKILFYVEPPKARAIYIGEKVCQTDI